WLAPKVFDYSLDAVCISGLWFQFQIFFQFIGGVLVPVRALIKTAQISMGLSQIFSAIGDRQFQLLLSFIVPAEFYQRQSQIKMRVRARAVETDRGAQLNFSLAHFLNRLV